MKYENKRKVNTQGDRSSGESVAANHPTPVPDCVASQNELHSEPGRYNPSGAERQKSGGSDPTSLRMRRDPERSAPAEEYGAAINPSQHAVATPAAFPEGRKKLQRTGQKGHGATKSVQRKRYSLLGEIVNFRRKWHVGQQITKGLQGISRGRRARA